MNVAIAVPGCYYKLFKLYFSMILDTERGHQQFATTCIGCSTSSTPDSLLRSYYCICVLPRLAKVSSNIILAKRVRTPAKYWTVGGEYVSLAELQVHSDAVAMELGDVGTPPGHSDQDEEEPTPEESSATASSSSDDDRDFDGLGTI